MTFVTLLSSSVSYTGKKGKSNQTRRPLLSFSSFLTGRFRATTMRLSSVRVVSEPPSILTSQRKSPGPILFNTVTMFNGGLCKTTELLSYYRVRFPLKRTDNLKRLNPEQNRSRRIILGDLVGQGLFSSRARYLKGARTGRYLFVCSRMWYRSVV
jgi:hypothetical protein